MLVLGFKQGDTVRVGEALIQVVEVRAGQIRLGFDAPRQVQIMRGNAKRRVPTMEVEYLEAPQSG